MHILIEKKQEALFDALTNRGMQSIDDQEDLEYIVCLAMEYLESKDPRTHSKFHGILTVNEKNVTDES
jgi:hypothetical protein